MNNHGGKRKGAGRKVGPAGETKAITVTIPIALLRKLDAKYDNRSAAVTEAIKLLVKRKK